jgi:hypothetical protein
LGPATEDVNKVSLSLLVVIKPIDEKSLQNPRPDQAAFDLNEQMAN